VTSQENKNEWFESHARPAVVAVTLLGFLARLWTASGTFLNPDEALHFRLANQASLRLAYEQSLTASHPPLLTVVALFLARAGHIRTLAAACLRCSREWLFVGCFTNGSANAAGSISQASSRLLFVAFLPPIVLLSTEVRQYALLLAFPGERFIFYG
jgi:hypothetical protein